MDVPRMSKKAKLEKMNAQASFFTVSNVIPSVFAVKNAKKTGNGFDIGEKRGYILITQQTHPQLRNDPPYEKCTVRSQKDSCHAQCA